MSLKLLLAITLMMCFIYKSSGGDLPADIKKCKTNDGTCIRDKIMEIFSKYPKGSPEIGMPNVSSFMLKNITISRAVGNSPIQLNFKFLQFLSEGLERANITRATGFVKELKNVEIDAIIPLLKISGDYVTNGKILLLALDGSGKGKFELLESKVKVRVKCHLEKRNGKNYAKITKLKADMEPKRMIAHLENLVRGNQELTDVLNSVINENWSDVWNELKDGINNAVAQVIINVMENVLQELAYDDFFSDSP